MCAESATGASASSACWAISLSPVLRNERGARPDCIRSRSRMSLISRTSRSELLTAMRSRLAAFSLTSPTNPAESSPRAPRIEVSGVRSSWLTVEMNSSFMRSSAYRWLISLKLSTLPTTLPPSCIGVSENSTGKEVPSLRKNTS